MTIPGGHVTHQKRLQLASMLRLPCGPYMSSLWPTSGRLDIPNPKSCALHNAGTVRLFASYDGGRCAGVIGSRYAGVNDGGKYAGVIKPLLN